MIHVYRITCLTTLMTVAVLSYATTDGVQSPSYITSGKPSTTDVADLPTNNRVQSEPISEEDRYILMRVKAFMALNGLVIAPPRPAKTPTFDDLMSAWLRQQQDHGGAFPPVKPPSTGVAQPPFVQAPVMTALAPPLTQAQKPTTALAPPLTQAQNPTTALAPPLTQAQKPTTALAPPITRVEKPTQSVRKSSKENLSFSAPGNVVVQAEVPRASLYEARGRPAPHPMAQMIGEAPVQPSTSPPPRNDTTWDNIAMSPKRNRTDLPLTTFKPDQPGQSTVQAARGFSLEKSSENRSSQPLASAPEKTSANMTSPILPIPVDGNLTAGASLPDPEIVTNSSTVLSAVNGSSNTDAGDASSSSDSESSSGPTTITTIAETGGASSESQAAPPADSIPEASSDDTADELPGAIATDDVSPQDIIDAVSIGSSSVDDADTDELSAATA